MSLYVKFPRTSNSNADALTTLASAVDSSLKRTIAEEYLSGPSIKTWGQSTVCDIEADLGVSWMDPIVKYHRDGTLPNDSNEVYWVQAQASRYWLLPDQSFTKGPSLTLT